METGKVVTWFERRGFGFIRPDTGGVDVFAHVSQVRGRELATGVRVEFEVESNPKGPLARQIRALT